MNRVLVSLIGLSLLALVLSACGGKPTTACEPRKNEVVVCLNGKPIDFSKEKNGPHKHETGSIYAPAASLAQALGVNAMIDAGARKVMVNGKAIPVVSVPGAKNIHLHDGVIFVPVKQFAEAAGLSCDVDYGKGTAGIAK